MTLRKFLCFLSLALPALFASLAGQTTVYSHNCDNLGGWVNTGLRYPIMQPGFDFQAVVPIVPANDHSPGAGGGVFYNEGNNFYQQAQALHYILYQIESPTINLTGFDDTRLEFFMQMRSETGNWDGGYVEWSTDGGNSWILLNQEICPSAAYDGNMSLNPSSTPYFQLTHPAWFNFRTTWTRVLIDVSAYDNLPNCKVRFTFHSDEAANDRGWAIDDIAVVSVAGIEVHGNSLNIPHNTVPNPANLTDFGQVLIGASQTHTFWIVNPGESPLNLTGTPPVQSNNPVFAVVQQPNPTTVPPGDSVSFQVQFSPAAAGIVNGQLTIAHSDSYSVCQPINPLLINVRGEAANTPPFMVQTLQDTSVCLNDPGWTWNFTVQDNEQAAGAIQATASSSNQALLPNGNLVLGGAGANRTLQATPVAGQSGTAVISLVLNDGQAQHFDSTFTFSVTVSDTVAPTALCQDISVTLNAQNQATIQASAIDAGSFDLCGIQSISLSQTSFDCSDVPQAMVSLTVTDFAGQTDQCQATVTVNPTPMQVQYTTSQYLPGGTELSCFGANDGAIGLTVSGGCAPIAFQWQNPVGNTSDSLSGLSAGAYAVQVSDAVGQSQVLSIDLDEPQPLIDQTAVVAARCAGSADGEAVLNAMGGVPPYTYSIGPVLTGLSAGVLNYQMVDAHNCILSGQAVIQSPDSLRINPAQERFDLVCGESAQLSFSPSGGVAPYAFDWSVPDVLSCLDCTEPVVRPSDNLKLVLEIRDANQCTVVQEFLFALACNVYVPNAFTPNGDGVNEVFLVRAGAAQEFSLRIHDRWGSVLFVSNDIEKGWTGKDEEGKLYPTGVYVWRLSMTLPGGDDLDMHGKVHLIR